MADVSEEKILLVQLHTRIPYKMDERLNEFVRYMQLPEEQRSPASADWPKTKQAFVIKALEAALPDYPLQKRPGPKKAPRVRRSPSTTVRNRI